MVEHRVGTLYFSAQLVRRNLFLKSYWIKNVEIDSNFPGLWNETTLCNPLFYHYCYYYSVILSTQLFQEFRIEKTWIQFYLM